MFADIVEFIKRESGLGWRITWNLLEIMARFGDPELRQALLKRCKDEKLNVEQLRRIASEMTKATRS
jgi:phosphoribosylamine-glycine ligase